MASSLCQVWRLAIFLAVLLASLVVGNLSRKGIAIEAASQSASSGPEKTGYLLHANEGEMLLRPTGKIVIKVDPRTGSTRLAMGTQQLNAGTGIRVHRHEHEDEVLFVQEGGGTAILGDARKTVEAGTTIYVPQGVWHGVENPGNEMHLLWVVTPPGLEGFFREIGTPPGAPLKALTPAQLSDIARKHGTGFKP